MQIKWCGDCIDIVRLSDCYSTCVSFYLSSMVSTVCPRSLDPFCMANYYKKWFMTSWTYSIFDCNSVKGALV